MTSELPEAEVTARLPCFATGTPDAATTNAAAVEMLNVCIVTARAAGVDRAFRRRNREHPRAHRRDETGQLVHGLTAHPETEKQAAELRRRHLAVENGAHGRPGLVHREPPALDHRGQGRPHDVAHRVVSTRPVVAATALFPAVGRWDLHPDGGWTRRSSAGRASTRRLHVRRRFLTKAGEGERAAHPIEESGLALAGLSEEVGQQARPFRSENGLRMELHPFYWSRQMADAHDHVVIRGPGGDHDLGRERLRGHAQGVVSRGHERVGHAREQPAAVVADARRLAVDERRGAPDRGSEGSGHGLHSQAHAQERDLALDRDGPRLDTPAESGSPGPGETTMPRSSAAGSAAIASMPARSIASLRRTRPSPPAASRAWTRLNVNELKLSIMKIIGTPLPSCRRRPPCHR